MNVREMLERLAKIALSHTEGEECLEVLGLWDAIDAEIDQLRMEATSDSDRWGP